MSHLQIPTCSGAQPLHSFLKLLPALVLSLVALAACGTAAAPHAGSPTQPASGGMAPTMAKAPTSARAQAAPPSQAAPAADPRGLGDPSAPITIVEYSDYQWPFCARFVRETKAKLEADYINTGKVYFVYRDFPLVDIHAGALLAAHIANCAGDQGAYWPMHDQLFEGTSARSWGNGDATDFSTFLGYAAGLQLDTQQLDACVRDNKYASQIEADFREAAALGVRSTPSFVVNGQLLVGAQPFEVWQELLDKLLVEQ